MCDVGTVMRLWENGADVERCSVFSALIKPFIARPIRGPWGVISKTLLDPDGTNVAIIPVEFKSNGEEIERANTTGWWRVFEVMRGGWWEWWWGGIEMLKGVKVSVPGIKLEVETDLMGVIDGRTVGCPLNPVPFPSEELLVVWLVLNCTISRSFTSVENDLISNSWFLFRRFSFSFWSLSSSKATFWSVFSSLVCELKFFVKQKKNDKYLHHQEKYNAYNFIYLLLLLCIVKKKWSDR